MGCPFDLPEGRRPHAANPAITKHQTNDNSHMLIVDTLVSLCVARHRTFTGNSRSQIVNLPYHHNALETTGSFKESDRGVYSLTSRK